MELLKMYIAQAERFNWVPSLEGYAAFIAQVEAGQRRQDGSWQWGESQLYQRGQGEHDKILHEQVLGDCTA